MVISVKRILVIFRGSSLKSLLKVSGSLSNILLWLANMGGIWVFKVVSTQIVAQFSITFDLEKVLHLENVNNCIGDSAATHISSSKYTAMYSEHFKLGFLLSQMHGSICISPLRRGEMHIFKDDMYDFSPSFTR